MPKPPNDASARWRALGLWRDATIAEEMRATLGTHGDAVLHIHSDERPATCTLTDFQRLAGRVAAGLRATGIGAGDVVAVQSPNWLEGMATFAGALRLGATVTPIVHIYGRAEIAFILRQSGAKAFVSPQRLKGLDRSAALADGVEQTAAAGRWFAIGHEGGGPARAWEDLLEEDEEIFDATARPDDVALLIYTSGTTSEPKGVQHSHNTFLAKFQTPTEPGQRAVNRPGPTLSPWPLGHVAGFMAMCDFVLRGKTVVFMDQWDPSAAAGLVELHRIQSTSGTPLHLTGLIDAAQAEQRDISSLKEYLAGATTVPASLLERCTKLGLVTYRAYGSSEHPLSISGMASDPLEKRLNTEGLPTAGVEVRLLDDDGTDVRQGSDGEIALKGPGQFVGYRDAAMNATAFTPDGWFMTGDVARQDSDGFYTVTDRKKDIIIRAGENISSREVENNVLAHPSVRDAAAVAEIDARTGERVCVFVTLIAGATLTTTDLKAWFAQRGVARQKVPENVIVLEELPKNAAGKTLKHVLRAQLLKEPKQ